MGLWSNAGSADESARTEPQGILYGAAEFSRDLDLAVAVAPADLRRLRAALEAGAGLLLHCRLRFSEEPRLPRFVTRRPPSRGEGGPACSS